MLTKKLSISFSKCNKDIYDYLKTKDNISNYICQLIRSKMNNKDILNPEFEGKIEEIIKKVLKENNYSSNNNSPVITNNDVINSLTEDDKSLINDLF
ncbi:hypothetical protein [Clostridium ljungdahlii]|uniref:Uncharacterized protein n=1 Tax=Clostridium ljungdahlii TaxID=1538 RepID=A0A168PIY5_9CLOT|nr:hypothetical protein [Clostridium ljungdahlii]OAA87804.1 hypothetical protein WY13_01919 [Clostridium ljungdahlii]